METVINSFILCCDTVSLAEGYVVTISVYRCCCCCYGDIEFAWKLSMNVVSLISLSLVLVRFVASSRTVLQAPRRGAITEITGGRDVPFRSSRFMQDRFSHPRWRRGRDYRPVDQLSDWWPVYTVRSGGEDVMCRALTERKCGKCCSTRRSG